jgi:hypothetical protein
VRITPAEGDHCYNLVTATAEEALPVVRLKPVAIPQLKAPFEPVQCAQFDHYDGHCRAVRIGLCGSRYSEISTVPTPLNRLPAMSFGTTWLNGGSGRLVSAQRTEKPNVQE